MIASAFDEKARNRDYEVIYGFDTIDNKLPFFGRSVQPDLIEKNIGRELSDEESKSQSNSLIVDNLWCRKCEKKLKIIEDYFLENIDKNTIDFSEVEGTEIKTINANVYLIRLFIYSLIMRASITKCLGFSLHKKIENRLKQYFTLYVKDDLSTTVLNLDNSQSKNDILEFPIRCIRLEVEKGKTSSPVFIHYNYDKPYCFIINQYIIQFYLKESHLRSTPYTFFGVSNIISHMDTFVNLGESNFKIGLFDLRNWLTIHDKFVRHFTDKKFKDLIHLYKVLFKRKTGIYPRKIQIQKFLNNLTQNDEKLGVKYTAKKIVDAINKNLG
jgi:hypothetical protein